MESIAGAGTRRKNGPELASLALAAAALAGLAIGAEASPVMLRGVATLQRPLTVDGLTGLLYERVPSGIAASFLAEPELRDAWLEARRTQGGEAPASVLLERVAPLAAFRRLMAIHGRDPDFRRAFSELALDPRLGPLARAVRQARSVPAADPPRRIDDRASLFSLVPQEARLKLEAVCVERGCSDMVLACREAGVEGECLAALEARAAAVTGTRPEGPLYAGAAPRLLRSAPAFDAAHSPRADTAGATPPASSAWETAGRDIGARIGRFLGDLLGRAAGDPALGGKWAKSGGDLGSAIGRSVADALAAAAKTLIETLGNLIGGAIR